MILRLRRTFGNARGISTLEFIAVFPILMVVFLVGVELCRAWFIANLTQNAVREGVRRAVVTAPPFDPIAAGVDRVNEVLGALSAANIPIVAGPTVTCAPTCEVNNMVTADVTVRFETAFFTFLSRLGLGPFFIRKSASMRYE